MAANTSMMVRDFTNNPEFVEELLPAAEHTALLYHLSYLSLAPFPKLERILREHAVETQFLFGSFEDFLLKCVTTSNYLVSSLLPLLKFAVEGNETELVIESLKTAKAWINEIINGVEDIIDRYSKQNRSMASCTSDMIYEKTETEKIKAQISDEIKSHEKALEELKEERKKILKKIDEIEEKIQEKNAEMQNHASNVRKKHEEMAYFDIVPCIEPLSKFIYYIAIEPAATSKTEALTKELSRLSSHKSDLRNRKWNIQVKMTDLQLKLVTLKEQQGTIPDPVHLKGVQTCLTQIQNILIQLQKIWKSVGEFLEFLEKNTFVAEGMIKVDMSEIRKGYFITSIDKAEEYWKEFGQSCLRARKIFSLETKDAYKFLEFTPSPGSEEWKQEYKSVMEKLNKINLQSICSVKDE